MYLLFLAVWQGDTGNPHLRNRDIGGAVLVYVQIFRLQYPQRDPAVPSGAAVCQIFLGSGERDREGQRECLQAHLFPGAAAGTGFCVF